MHNSIDPSEPVAIVGLGGIFPGSKDIPGFWRSILSGKDSIGEVPQERWDWRLYYDSNPAAPDKTYSKIGGFVRDFTFDAIQLRIPPPVAQQMDTVQQLAVVATAEALADSGYDSKIFDRARTAVVFGNSMGGPKKEATDLRVYTAAFRDRLLKSPTLARLSAAEREAAAVEVEAGVKAGLCAINEDTMPGELSNVIAGRVANVFNVNGPNFTVDAACASSLAAISQAINGLRFRQYDMVITGGVDQMMAAPAYVKFCKIGALSPDGSRPFDAGANGFVMGEGAGALILKRLCDAKKDGDKIYALIRAIGASSDGKGKGITAPNPKGQKLAVERTFEAVDYRPEDVGLLEAHGTSTKVGDVVEVQTASEVFASAAPRSIALGSVKSQIGHLKAAAGAAGIIKAALALKHKILPPSINFKTPNPGIDWKKCPFYVNTEAKPWQDDGKPRRAHVSAFGFGGTNFHVALEEATDATTNWRPALAAASERQMAAAEATRPARELPLALGGEAVAVRGADLGRILNRLERLKAEVPAEGPLTALAARLAREAKGERGDLILAVAAESGAKLQEKIDLALKSASADLWEKAPPAFKPKGIYPGRRAAKRPKIGFMFPGQGSQYVDMLKDLREKYKAVADTFAEADAIMEPLIGRTLTDILFTKGGETPERVAAMQEQIKQTEITQPAVLTADIAILRLLRQYGVEPDVVCGHSLGEYGALVAAGVLEFKDALLAVSSRAKEMAHIQVDDCGRMASVAAPVEKVELILKQVDGYVIAANKNCPIQTVIAGATKAVEAAAERFAAEGIQAQFIEVSHAFHSEIVAPAQKPYGRFLQRVEISAPKTPILSNVTADYYPRDAKGIRALMVSQIAEPVEFIREAERMYKDGVRVFVEVGPKRALTAFLTSILEGKPGAHIVASNHPKRGGIHEFNDLLARLLAAGVELDLSKTDPATAGSVYTADYRAWSLAPAAPAPKAPAPASAPAATQDLLDRWDIYLGPVAVSGISAGAPGKWDKVFRETAMDGIIAGQNLIEPVEEGERRKIVEKNLERVVKSETGDHRIERLESIEEVLRLAGQAGKFDFAGEFGVRGSVSSLMDVTAQLSLAAGILALRDAGIPLVQHYKKTTTGGLIPTTWGLPESLQDGMGVIMASAFPGLDSLIDDVSRHLTAKFAGKSARMISSVYDRMIELLKDPADRKALTEWYVEARAALGPAEAGSYKFSRSFLFRVMALGHAQTSQFIKAKGPCTQVNAACASTTQAVGIAEDWIRLGRAKRVLIIAADDITNPTLMSWLGTGFLSSGAATTANVLSEAALPFDRRRNGMIIGMGAAGMVLEDGREVERRGMEPLALLLAAQFDNSAYHVTRLSLGHVRETMDRLVLKAEKRHGLRRSEMAGKMLFMSHETYTPAQGGSSQAEVEALKHTFGPDVSKIVVTNTKGFTGHSMGASLEDVVAVRSMNLGKLPPIANYREPDPELSGITLSKGGDYDCEYALRLGAGFGSQIAMTLMRRGWRAGTPRIPAQGRYDGWIREISGDPQAELEVVHNTLRVKDSGRRRARAAESGPAKGQPPKIQVPAPATPDAHAHPNGVRDLAAAASRRPASDEAALAKEIVTLVAEKTGYPAQMLELDLDMEADLGIDTVKQAELIGLIRERYGIPLKENLSLKSYPTLRHVIGFVRENTGSTSGAAPAPVSAPATAPTPAPAAALDAGTLTAEITAMFADKTGYPAAMLEPDLDMEADLGIDTVKQAELIGLIRERYGIPRKENLSLKDYPTLRHVVRFVMENAGLAAQTQPAPVPAAAAAAAGTGSMPAQFTRWALESRLAPAAGAPPSLSGKPVVVLAADEETAKPFAEAVSEAGGNPALLKAQDWETAEKAKAALAKLLKGEKAGGVLDLTGLSFEDFGKMTPASFDKAYRRSVKALFLVAQALREDLLAAPAESFVLCVTRLGGAHGAEPAKAANPLGGSLTGLTKALRHELAGARVCSVDFDLDSRPADMARLALAELGSGDARSEVGFAGGARRALRLARRDTPVDAARRIGNKTSFMITGGGQGLGAELAKEIARRWRAPLVLVGRTPLAKEAASWARMTPEELKALKMRMWEDLKKDSTRKATPARLEREFSRVTKAVALQTNIEEMCRLGSKVLYVPADTADAAEVSKAVKAALRQSPAIDVVIHAAGLEESKLLADKKPEDFDRVYRAKAHGAVNLLKAVPPTRNQTWVFFSSVVGRFGNLAQTDYAAASDFLAKLAGWLRAQGRQAMAFDLTAFSGVGMATRGGVEAFLTSQGVGFMTPKTGVGLMIEELLHNAADSEVLLAGPLGKLDEDRILDPLGTAAAPKKGSAPAAAPRSEPVLAAAGARQPSPTAAPAAKAAHETAPGPALSRTFALDSDPWLADHAIGGVPYVPGVMGLELMARAVEAARGALPGSLEDVSFSLPVKLLRNRPATVKIAALPGPGGLSLALSSDFVTAQGIKLGGPKTHFTAKAPASDSRRAFLQEWTRVEPPAGDPARVAVGADAIYSAYFHGPSFQVLAGLLSTSEKQSLALYRRPARPLWPKGGEALRFNPMLIEAAFQACGYRDLHYSKRMTLPDSIGRVLVFETGAAPEELLVWTRYKGAAGNEKSVYDAYVYEPSGRLWAALENYRMIAVS